MYMNLKLQMSKYEHAIDMRYQNVRSERTIACKRHIIKLGWIKLDSDLSYTFSRRQMRATSQHDTKGPYLSHFKHSHWWKRRSSSNFHTTLEGLMEYVNARWM